MQLFGKRQQDKIPVKNGRLNPGMPVVNDRTACVADRVVVSIAGLGHAGNEALRDRFTVAQ
jgi:hypothetical protein